MGWKQHRAFAGRLQHLGVSSRIGVGQVRLAEAIGRQLHTMVKKQKITDEQAGRVFNHVIKLANMGEVVPRSVVELRNKFSFLQPHQPEKIVRTKRGVFSARPGLAKRARLRYKIYGDEEVRMREMLGQKLAPSKLRRLKDIFMNWMRVRYSRLNRLPESEERQEFIDRFGGFLQRYPNADKDAIESEIFRFERELTSRTRVPPQGSPQPPKAQP